MVNSTFIYKVKKWGTIILVISTLCEVFFFYSIPNLFGVLMTWISWYIFQNIGLKEEIIKDHFFSWLIFLSMSLYRIIPLFATILEWKPISYGFQVPYDTFIGESFLYIVSSLAFYYAVVQKKGNNGIQRLLFKYGYYNYVSNKYILILGLVGLIIRFYSMVNPAQIGDVIGKFLVPFVFLQNAPLLLLFPSLYSSKCNVVFEKNRVALFWFLFLFISCFFSNSRASLLEPIVIVVLLFLLSYVNCNVRLRIKVNKKIVFGGILVVFVVVPILSDISDSMLIARGIRSNVSRKELFSATMNNFLDKEGLKRFRSEREKTSIVKNYSEGWTEVYLDNFALNRVANLRITDITLYHAENVGYGNEAMQNDLKNCILRQIPQPILNFLGIDIDKRELFSRGDLLYSMSFDRPLFAGLRVTSHLADGLSTFGAIYFVVQYILFYLQFLLVETFVFKKNGSVFYSIFGLITVFSFLGQFRNANGCMGEISYLIRGYWQFVFISLVVMFFLRFLAIPKSK